MVDNACRVCGEGSVRVIAVDVITIDSEPYGIDVLHCDDCGSEYVDHELARKNTRMRDGSMNQQIKHLKKILHQVTNNWLLDADPNECQELLKEIDSIQNQTDQVDNLAFDLFESLVELERMAYKCDDGQYMDYPGARSIFHDARENIERARKYFEC